MPLLSIIIPVFNQEKYLRACLESIVSQSFDGFEVILVDDGSYDNSLCICLKCAEKDKRFKVFHQENKGVSAARNLGLSKSTGEYICFVDADDTLPENALDKLYDGMNGHVDMVIGGYSVYDGNGAISYEVTERTSTICSREEGIKQMYCSYPYRYLGYCWAKLFKRKIIEAYQLTFDEDIKFNEDRLYVTKYIAAQKGDIAIFTEPVYFYLDNPNSSMASTQGTFNEDYVTDFAAMRRMKSVVSKSFRNTELIKLANEGIFYSYLRIHQMMNENGKFQKKIHRKMRKELISSVPISFIIKKKLQK